MSILIHMEMPKDGECIVIQSDGTAYKYNPGDVVMYGDAYNETADAIELPPHGRLIDADALLTHRFNGVVGKTEKSSYMVGWNTAIEAVAKNADTIIPADPEEVTPMRGNTNTEFPLMITAPTGAKMGGADG